MSLLTLVLPQFSSDSCCCSFSSVKSSAVESLRCSFSRGSYSFATRHSWSSLSSQLCLPFTEKMRSITEIRLQRKSRRVWGRTRGRVDVLLFKRFTCRIPSNSKAPSVLSYVCSVRCDGLDSFWNCFLGSLFVLSIESSFGVACRLVEETDIAAQHCDNV